MFPTAVLPGNPITDLVNLNAVRYVTISATAVLIYDTILTLPDEIRLVWAALLRSGNMKEYYLKILYLFARYTMITVCAVGLIMIMPVVSLSNKWMLLEEETFYSSRSKLYGKDNQLPTHSGVRCSNAEIFTGAADIILESIASGVVFYRLYKLWRFESRGKWILGAVFLVGKVIVWTFTFVNMARIDHTMFYIEFGNWRLCSTTSAPRLALGVWIPDALLDISLVVFFILNALSRPRLESQNLLNIIYKDGIQFFLTMICMRAMNVGFTAFAPVSLFFLATLFSGAMVTTVSSRVFLGLFDEAEKSLENKCYDEEESDSDDIPMTLKCACPECTHGPCP